MLAQLMLTALVAFPTSSESSAEVRADAQLARLNQAAKLHNWRALPLGERVARVGLHFLGTPYVGGTLETPGGPERCIVRLDGLDCVTLFETSLAYARLMRKNPKPEFDDLENFVRQTRYRHGREDGYLSRLHYTTDWFDRNTHRAIVRVLDLPGSQPLVKTINFMSTHASSYPMLEAKDMSQLVAHESRISQYKLPYVPKEKVRDIEKHLQTGDIVGLVTRTAGIDIAHTGLIVRQGRRAHFLHASSLAKKVVLDKPISECLDSRSLIGVMVARPIGQ